MLDTCWPCRTLPLFFVACFLSISVLQPEKAASNFTIGGDEYACNVNVICLGDAHIDSTVHHSNFSGSLSLARADLLQNGSAGIAYYHEPARLLDPIARRTASFKASFQFFIDPYVFNNTAFAGDGMAFIISSDNSIVGDGGGNLGYFHAGYAPFRSVVVEFDSYMNAYPPMNDVNDNHVSIDINNITAVVARNASDLGFQFVNRTLAYAWVEYSAGKQVLEVRISQQDSRPASPFLSRTVNLVNALEEYMWVGFSASNGLQYSSYYIGNWSFEAYGFSAEVVATASSSRKKRWGSLRNISPAVVGISTFAAAFLLVLAMWVFQKRKQRGRGLITDSAGAYRSSNIDVNFCLAQDGFRFTYEELSLATGGFADEAKLGQGGFGSVYRGYLKDDLFPIAVKRFSRESQQGEREFRAEVSIISQLRHRNLIRLLGWCIEVGKYYIVYELMPNGSLDQNLLSSDYDQQDGCRALSWPQRLKVMRGTATAVEYLHHGWNQQVIHRDIKASNIMLDEQWNAKLGDFGLARLTNHQQTPNTTLVAGTPGYIAPEAVATGKFTEMSDVFAFGALALEVACGRKAINLRADSECMLVDWVWQHLSEGNLLSVVDRRLEEYDVEQMKTLLLLGLVCSHPDPAQRPPTRLVVQILYGEAPVPFVPTAKPSPIYANPNPPQPRNMDLDLHNVQLPT